MVKANAYGHGLRAVGQRLDGLADALGVASLDEALALRQAGVQTPLLLIEGVFHPEELTIAAAYGFRVVFHHASQLKWLAQTFLPKPIEAWVKIDTGMGRLGFAPEDAAQVLKILAESPSVEGPVTLLSHLACADEPEHPLNQQQIKVFEDVARGHQGPKSLCNSAGVFAFPEVQQDWVRPGLALYGASPLNGRSAAALGLKPVMCFHTQLIAVKKLKQGAPLGYGARFICPEDMPVGIMAVGYGDGYPRQATEQTPVLVENMEGKRTRCLIAGRVSMDMAAIDLRPCPTATVGSRVILWGEALPVEEVAASMTHSAYDLLTGVQNRVRFEWV